MEVHPTCGAKITELICNGKKDSDSLFPPSLHLFIYLCTNIIKHIVCANDYSGARGKSSDKIDLSPWSLCFKRGKRQQTKPTVCELVLNVTKENEAEKGSKK